MVNSVCVKFIMVGNEVLPDNPDELKKMIGDLQKQYENELKEKKRELHHRELQYQLLEEKYKILQRRFFGRKSEKISDTEHGQLLLINEAEMNVCVADTKEPAVTSEKILVKSHVRAKKQKERFPSHLPEKEVVHEGSAEEKACPCCGKDRPCIGAETSREIDIIPEQVRIIKHIQKKYGPCDCAGFEKAELSEVVIAEKPKRLLPGTIGSIGLLAYIFVSKFLDGIPYYRQEKRFGRLGIDISRTNMCNWQISSTGTDRFQDLLGLMWKEIRSGPFMQMDESGMQVLKEPGRPAQSKGYMFVTIGYNRDHKPMVMYHYHPTRNKKIVADILEGFKGYLQTDGLGIYNDAEQIDGIFRVGCGAHIRRKFFEAAEQIKGKTGIAHMTLSYYNKISRIEQELRKDKTLSHSEFEEKRRELMEPILNEFHEYLIKKQPIVPPESKLGNAIRYALKEWPKWIRFLDKWYITPDNNYTERKVKSFVIGRKNWMFADTLRGAYSSAGMYSVIQSAEANGLNAYWYSRYVYTLLPYVETEDDLRKLLPTEVTKEELERFMVECF